MKKAIIAPSILSANWCHLLSDIKQCENTDATYLHFDVMDGHFVPNISFGIAPLKCIANETSLVKDVHLMISEPLKYIEAFSKAGADIITFHYEACKNFHEVDQVIALIHSYGKKAGISIKPQTDVKKLIPFLDNVELVLIMSVEPGFGGQEFMDNCLSKILFLKDYANRNDVHYLVEVDGGINKETSKLCRLVGVDILVAGSYVFKGNIKERIASLNEE